MLSQKQNSVIKTILGMLAAILVIGLIFLFIQNQKLIEQDIVLTEQIQIPSNKKVSQEIEMESPCAQENESLSDVADEGSQGCCIGLEPVVAVGQESPTCRRVEVNTVQGNNRILITPEYIRQNFGTVMDDIMCKELFNVDPANTQVEYKNIDKGIIVSLPYNDNWGNGKYRVNPYDYEINPYGENYDIVSFGRIDVFEGCGWIRNYTLKIMKSNETSEVISNLKDGDLTSAPSIIRINGRDVIKYEGYGLCNYPTLEVVGSKYNYNFSPVCGIDSKEEFEILEDIVETIEIVDTEV